MNRLFVTIVDVLGVFVPGVLALIGVILLILFLPGDIHDPVTANSAMSILASGESSLSLKADSLEISEKTPELGSNLWILVGAAALFSYVFGFLVRIWSIRFLAWASKPFWSSKLKDRASILKVSVEKSLHDPGLCSALKKLGKTARARHPDRYAPYFSFIKRMLRQYPNLWIEAERLEAEIRFLGGLFLPFALLMFDGLLIFYWWKWKIGLAVAAVSFISCIALACSFPTWRIKEVLHVYYLAVLTRSGVQSSGESHIRRSLRRRVAPPRRFRRG